MNIPEGPLTLLILLGAIIILGFVINSKNKQLKTPETIAAVPAELQAAPTEEIKESGISPAVVAAITASICLMTGKSAEEFKFKAIRRAAGNYPVWTLVGTTDLIANRQRFFERGNK